MGIVMRSRFYTSRRAGLTHRLSPFIWGCSQVVRLRTLTPASKVRSLPALPVTRCGVQRMWLLSEKSWCGWTLREIFFPPPILLPSARCGPRTRRTLYASVAQSVELYSVKG